MRSRRRTVRDLELRQIEVTGRGAARGWIGCSPAASRPRSHGIAPMLYEAGRIIGDLSIACLAPDRYCSSVGLRRGLPHALVLAPEPAADVLVRRAASTLTGLCAAGPHARTLMQRLVGFRPSNQAFRLFAVRETAGRAVARHPPARGFTGELGYEVWVTPDFQESSTTTSWPPAKGWGSPISAEGPCPSFRLEKGYGSFNKDFRPDYTPAETGLDAFVDFAKPVDFIGRDAVLAERESGAAQALRHLRGRRGRRRRHRLRVDAEGRRPRRPRHLRRLRPLVGKSIAMGYVPAELARGRRDLRDRHFGRECAAVSAGRPLHDPDGEQAALVSGLDAVAAPRGTRRMCRRRGEPARRTFRRALASRRCRGWRTAGRRSRCSPASRSSASSPRAFRVLEEAGLEIRGRKGARRSTRAAAPRWTTRPASCGSAATSSRPIWRTRRSASCCTPATRRAICMSAATSSISGRSTARPTLRDLEGGRRYGDIAAFRDILKVTHALGVLHWQGGVVVEPVDVPVPARHLDMYRAHIECSDIVWAARGVGGVQARGRAGHVGHRARRRRSRRSPSGRR